MAKTPTKAEREKTRKQLLAAEVALLLLLLSAAKKRNAEDAIVAALLSSQTRSKLLARQRFAAELRIPLATPKEQTRTIRATTRREERTQRRLAKRFLKTVRLRDESNSAFNSKAAAEAARRQDEAKSAANPKAAARAEAARRRRDEAKSASNAKASAESAEAALRRIATTESVRAFEEERRRSAEEFSRVSGTPFEKEWDATMDRRTFDICAGLHGRVVPLAQEFPSGDPPLHPNCRCSVEYRPAT